MNVILIIISVIAIVFVWAYFFPKGVNIFGIPAELFFSKDNSDKNKFK